MKSVLIFFSAIILNSAGYKIYKMDNNLFRCIIPSDWKIERDREKDLKDKIYRVIIVNPIDWRNTISIKYYSSQSGKKYDEFIELNSKTADGKLEGPNEKYEKVKEISLDGRKAFEINRKLKEFSSIDSSSDSYWLKEKIIVIPAKVGFYVITYSAEEKSFSKNQNVLENIIKSFKSLY
ncbi:MAG: hypothetical protein N2446_00670 [Elusimicrobiales bacterium]|nr:hypothetical protein [Elusimicrobiales bacterium]